MNTLDEPKQAQSSQATKTTYFFPNYTQGLPFSCEAASPEEADEANKQYLKQQKENH
jgi:hypothetical protein